MKVQPEVFTAALEEVFVEAPKRTNPVVRYLRMRLLLKNEGFSAVENITMETKIDKEALPHGVCQLTGPVFFVIPAGDEVEGLHIFDNNDVLVEEAFAEPEVYPEVGTFTVNNVMITLSST